MAIIRLQHYGVTVGDHRSAGRFYSKVIGIPKLGSVVQKQRRSLIGRHRGVPNVRISWFQRGHDAMELFSFPGIERDPLPKLRRDFSNVGPARLAFRVTSIKRYELVLSSKNIEFNKAKDPWGEDYLSFTDPDMVPMAFYGGAEKGVNLDRATITVSNLNNSMAFYSVVLGLPEVTATRLAHAKEIFPDSKYDGTVRVAKIGIGGKGVELVEFQGVDHSDKMQWFPDPEIPYDTDFTNIGIKHVCFQVKNSRQMAKSLKADGVRIIMGPAREPSGLRVTYLLDPDGVVIELYELPEALSKMVRGFSLFWARFMTQRA